MYDEADDMCPNCCTPWKCNGPHIMEQTPAYQANYSVDVAGTDALIEDNIRLAQEAEVAWEAGFAAGWQAAMEESFG